MAEAWSPGTTDQRLSLPLNGTIYTTERSTAGENRTPLIGGTMETILGASWKDSIVVASVLVPKGGQKVERITHARIPKLEDQDANNFEFVGVDLGGQKYAGVSRTYVYPRKDFDESSPAAGAAMPDGPEAKFQGLGYILVNRIVQTTGLPLEPVFVVERREYVQRVSIRTVDIDQTTGRGVGEVSTLYFRGEKIGDVTIEALIADPANVFWGVQSDGTVRRGNQLTDDWFVVVTTSSRDAALLSYLISYASTVDLRLPAVLDSISVVWSSSAGNGSYSADWTGIASGTSKHLSGAESGDAQGSAGVQPELVIHITKPEGNDIPSMAYVFFAKLTDDSFSEAALLARLETLVGAPVSRWPHFRPRAHTLILQGAKVAVQARASANASYSDSSDSHSEDLTQGAGTSVDVALSVTAVNLPETIHGAITITGATNTAAASASAEVGWAGWGGFPSASAAASLSSSAAGSVSPTSLSATSPSSIPSSGHYLALVRIEPHSEFGWMRVYAEVINAASLTL